MLIILKIRKKRNINLLINKIKNFKNVDWMNSMFLYCTWLYLAISLCNVRSNIMATIPERNKTIINELRILNHWIFVCGIDSKI